MADLVGETSPDFEDVNDEVGAGVEAGFPSMPIPTTPTISISEDTAAAMNTNGNMQPITPPSALVPPQENMDLAGQDVEMTSHANPEEISKEETGQIGGPEAEITPVWEPAEPEEPEEPEHAEPINTKPDGDEDPHAHDKEGSESAGNDLQNVKEEGEEEGGEEEDIESNDQCDDVDNVDADADDDGDDDDIDSSSFVTAARRSSIAKTPIPILAFERLPNEIIQQILQATDPASFASLVLVNSKWHRVAQQADLYALQLTRCPAYAARSPSTMAAPRTKPAGYDKESRLPQLRRLFAQEVKRGMFAAYMRPAETAIKLISNSISSSSAPGGEGMQFSPSPRGHHILAYNSSRIYLLDMRGPAGHMVKRELKILRRPASVCTTDDGSLLAVLSTEMQVDLYDLQEKPPKRRQSLLLDHAPRTITLSPCGSVLAAAYEGGIEVTSVNPGALPTERRAVKCDAVDSLAFSFDGTQLLGTTTGASSGPNTVILTAPYYDPGSLMAEENSISPLWTTSILFPNTSRDCSHAVLLQYSAQEEASWTFAYDGSFETFRAVRIDDLRNGTTYFPGPVPAPSPTSQAKLLPCTLPAPTYRGELVSAGFQGKDVWLYGVPGDLDAVPEVVASGVEAGSSSAAGVGRRESVPPPQRSGPRLVGTASGRVPQWQVLCDNSRNNLVGGAKVTELDGVSNVKWVAGYGNASTQERLVVAARGVIPGKLATDEDDVDFVDGGRITLLDFDYALRNGEKRELTLEIGTDDAEILEEEQRDIETEVAIVRRRTVAQRRGGDRRALLRAATTTAAASRPQNDTVPPGPPLRMPMPMPMVVHDAAELEDDQTAPRRLGVPLLPNTKRTEQTTPLSPADAESSSLLDEAEALDLPYSHASPRSGPILRRAATAMAANRHRHPQERIPGNSEYRRADGRREHPHESDADNWVPPPPPYQKEAPLQDLPAFLRHPAVGPGGIMPASGPSRDAQPPPIIPTPQQSLAAHGCQLQRPVVTQSIVPASLYPPHSPSVGNGPQTWRELSHHRRSISLTTDVGRPESSSPRPLSSSSAVRGSGQFGSDHYDVSPPESPSHFSRHSPFASAPSPVASQAAMTALATRNHNVRDLPSLPSDATERIRQAATHQPVPSHPVQPPPPMPARRYWPLPDPSHPQLHQSLHPHPHPHPQEQGQGQGQGPVSPAPMPAAYAGTFAPIPVPVPTPASQGTFVPITNDARRFTNVPTWPLNHRPAEGQARPQTEIYRNAGPPPMPSVIDMPGQPALPPLPPLPRPDQLAGLQRHLNQGPPRRFSREFTMGQIPRFGRAETDPITVAPQPSFTHDRLARPLSADQAYPPPPDVPLIISTPTGVIGAFDRPARPTSLAEHPDPPIFAPVPRRSTPRSLDIRPTVDRLDTIHSTNPKQMAPSLDVTPMLGHGSQSRPRSRHRSIFGSILSRPVTRSPSPPPPLPAAMSLPAALEHQAQQQELSASSGVSRRKSTVQRTKERFVERRARKSPTPTPTPTPVPVPVSGVGLGIQQEGVWEQVEEPVVQETSSRGSKCTVM